MYIETNKYQTPITDELLAEYPEEIQEWFYDFVTNVLFIKNLISPDRKYARDLPRDEKGRIIVDITNPHIIEDADYFRQPALHFMKHQCYTFLKPNSNPHSEYRRFWDEELRRCRDGYVRPSDGEWVTGFCYWFLNYCPMMVNMITEGRKKAIRTESFPFFFEGIYLRFHYLWQARESGKHAIELAKRGAHPYDEKVFTPQGWKLWADINIGSQLFDTTGAITTVIDISSNGLMPVYKITLRDGRQVKCSDDHKWVVKIHNHKQAEILSTLELLNIYKKRRKISVRIPSGIEYTAKILKNNGINLPYKDTLVDPYTFGLLLGDGCFRHRSCYFIQHPKDLQEERNYIPYEIIQWKSKYSYRIVIPNWSTILNTYNLSNKKSEDKFIPDEFKYNSREVRLNILKGLMDSDGSIHNGVPNINTTSEKLRDDIIEVARSLGYQSSYIKKKAGYKVKGIYKECLPTYDISIYADSEIFNLNRKKILVKYNSTNAKSRKEGSIITNIEYLGEDFCKCVEVDSKDSCYLIGDFITTHNCAKSYSLASIMSHNLILGENAESCRRVITVLTAYEKEYLKDDKDGTLSKFKPAINFQFTNTPFPHLLLKNSPNEMTWQMGYKDELGIERGSLNQVLGVSAKDNPDKLRGKRGWILFEEMGSFKGLLALYDTTRKSVEDGDYTFATMYLVGCVCAGTKVWTLDGRNISIENLTQSDGIIGFTDSFSTNTMPNIYLSRGVTKEPIINQINIAKKKCVKITLSNRNNLKCSIDHPILIQKLRMNHDGSIRYYEEIFKKAGDLSIGDRVIESREIPIFGMNTLFDARLVGMLIGDGSYGLRQSPKYSSEDEELLNYIKDRYVWSLSATHITKKNKIYEDIRIKDICPKLRKIGIYGQVKDQKRLPNNYQTLTKEDTSLLLSGLYDTDGSIWFNKDGYISLTQSNRIILEQVQLLWRKFGVIGTIVETKPKIQSNRKDKNSWYTLTISGRYNCLRAYQVLSLLVAHKKETLENIKTYYDSTLSKKSQKYPEDIVVYKVTSIEDIGEQEVYNLTAGLSHTYLANNIVTHNTAAEKESDFSSAKTLLYSPDGYNILALPNVYDKQKQGKAEFGFFYPSYVNRAGCYNKDGVSDVVKALLQILTARYKAKYSADPKSVLRVIAEDPVTPQEAIIKVKNAYFPIQQIEERIAQIDQNPRFYDDTYVGFMIQNQNGEAEFKNTADIPIRDFPTADNKEHGAIEIFVMPERDSRGKKFENRYIAGIDPIDNDSSETMSLFSIHILDLFTDQLVAEYTGRLDFVDDCYEQARLLLMFYNAVANYENNLKGLYSYFRKMNCTHLLCDTPEYLKDKQLIKVTSTGNNIKGVRATAPINNYANGLLRDWLLKPVTIISKDEEGQEIEITIPNLFLIKNRAVLKELVLFTPEMNVDRIRALGMLMLYREEKMILYQGDMSKANQEKVDSDYLGNDDYFSRNFNMHQRQFSKFSKFNVLS